MDILLDRSGDLFIGGNGDITLSDSVAQKIKIRLKWFEAEWRWNRDEGLPYTESLLVKNPDTDYFEGVVREKIFEVDEVTDVGEVSVIFDAATRKAKIRFVASTDYETIKEEVDINCQITE